MCGIKLPQGLSMAQKLPQPIFTPASKAPMGEHDEKHHVRRRDQNRRTAPARRAHSQDIDSALREAADFAAKARIIIADTKF